MVQINFKTMLNGSIYIVVYGLICTFVSLNQNFLFNEWNYFKNKNCKNVQMCNFENCHYESLCAWTFLCTRIKNLTYLFKRNLASPTHLVFSASCWPTYPIDLLNNYIPLHWPTTYPKHHVNSTTLLDLLSLLSNYLPLLLSTHLSYHLIWPTYPFNLLNLLLTHLPF